MEEYPPQYVENNLPLVLLSGLGEVDSPDISSLHAKRQESGVRIHINSPECQDERSRHLLQELMALDGTQRAWNSVALPGPSGKLGYKMRTVGRSYVLPARKAAPQPQSPGAEAGPASKTTELHSPISPLSPGSPIFPDGIFTPLWFLKHQQQAPAIFLAVFESNAAEASSQDEQLKVDILAVRSALSRSGYKTRFGVVLLSDRSILHAPELEERMTAIRRATSLDAKTGLFFMPPMSSQAEVATFIQGAMNALQASCVEHYKDLSKHARRKKARGGPLQLLASSIGGAAQSTLSSGWNARYEVKQGAFAEFCQEMEVAERHYSAAIEELFSVEGVFETTPSWSPRWSEARLLCDCLAIRTIRCQLWNGSTTGAAQSWMNYKLRMRDLLDRRGMGSSTYSWNAWEARWAGIMSQLIQLADMPSLQKALRQSPEHTGDAMPQRPYFLPENSEPNTDRLLPSNFLHHSGYWLRLFAKGLRARWEKALAIPEEDRVPPGQSPASAVANRSKAYDSYLVPDPHEEYPACDGGSFDHAEQLGIVCVGAAEAFDARAQLRMSEDIRFGLAHDLVRAYRYDAAIDILLKLWEESSWRFEEWHGPFRDLLLFFLQNIQYSKSSRNAKLVPILTWELLSVGPADPSDGALDLTSCLDYWDELEKVSLAATSSARLSPLFISFAFKTRQTNVGEPSELQLVLDYRVPISARSITISRLEARLEPSKTIVIQHRPNESSQDRPSGALATPEKTGGGSIVATDLTLRPSQKRIVNLSTVFREAQASTMSEILVFLSTDKFEMQYSYEENAIASNSSWYVEKEDGLASHLLPHFDSRTIQVLPKPPKVELSPVNLRSQYYVDEEICIAVELRNDETEVVSTTVTPKIISENGESIDVRCKDAEDGQSAQIVSDLRPSASQQIELVLCGPADAGTFTLGIDLHYTLPSEPEMPLTKTLTVELQFVTAIEINFSISHLLHSAPWPSFFTGERSGKDKPSGEGIMQMWKLNAPTTILATDELILHGLSLQVNRVEGDATCSIRESQQNLEKSVRAPENISSIFEFVTQKQSLDDRRPIHLDLSLAVEWSRGDENSRRSTTALSAPRFTIPTSEPRVLCTIDGSKTSRGETTVQYHLENPSTHFLTFALTMEASEEFAFSGPKYRTLSLAPLSRHRVDYRLLLHDELDVTEEQEVWVSPMLQVVDSFYQKNLRVYAGGQGVRLDEKKEIAVRIARA